MAEDKKRVRNKQISFRVSEAEYEKIKHNADIKGTTVAKLAQSKVLSMDWTNPVMDSEHAKETIRLLANLSNNVNQIARVCNQGLYQDRNEELDSEINHFREELDHIWRLLR